MKDDKINPDIFKIDEAARYLGVTRRWVYRRIWSGDLPASKVGGLYFLRRQDIETLIDQGRLSGLHQETSEPGADVLKCGYCFRLLSSDALIGDVCEAVECEKLICVQCWAEGNHYCIQHVPERDSLWNAALEKFRRGDFQVLVKANQARLREVNFIQRLQTRLSAIDTLRHPLSDEVLTIQNWDTLLEETDERSEIMKLMNKMVLESDWASQIPLNPSVCYQIPASNRQKNFPVAILAQVFSHSRVMLQMGYDIQPFGVAELTPLLLKFGDQAQKEQVFTLVMLASVTGWDAEAREVIRGEIAGSSFAHRWMLVYLNDLEKRELIYNRSDNRARGYADLFTSILPGEDVDEVISAIKKEMGIYESMTMPQALQALSYSQNSIEKAFAHLAASGHFALTEVPGIGPAIVRI